MQLFSRVWPSSLAVRTGFLATVLACLQPRHARAEDSLSYKFQSYREDHDRIAVDSSYGLLEKDFGPDTHLKLMGVIDAIAGATPTGETAPAGQPTPLTQMHERRKAWDARLDHQFPRLKLALGFNNSRESDYLSRGWSINTTSDFNQKNTLLLLGYGRTDDRINPTFWKAPLHKNTDDFFLGLTQLLSPSTSFNTSLTYGESDGYLSDPYKLVSKTVLYDIGIPGFPLIPIPTTPPENRPAHRDKLSALMGVNHHFDRLHAALDASYRFYHDDFGITSHTAAIEWLQKLGRSLVLCPALRYYQQSAADFYFHDLDLQTFSTSTDDRSPAGSGRIGTGRAPFYSSDYRLSSMRTVTISLKLVWTIRPWLSLDVTGERYLMTGLDSVTPQDAYADARIFTVGIKLSR